MVVAPTVRRARMSENVRLSFRAAPQPPMVRSQDDSALCATSSFAKARIGGSAARGHWGEPASPGIQPVQYAAHIPRTHPEVPERSAGLEGDLRTAQRPLEPSFAAAVAEPQDEGGEWNEGLLGQALGMREPEGTEGLLGQPLRMGSRRGSESVFGLIQDVGLTVFASESKESRDSHRPGWSRCPALLR